MAFEMMLRERLRQRMHAIVEAKTFSIFSPGHLFSSLEAELETDLTPWIMWFRVEIDAYLEELQNDQMEARVRELLGIWGITGSDVPIILKKFKEYNDPMTRDHLQFDFKGCVRDLVNRFSREIENVKILKKSLKDILGKRRYRKHKAALVKKFEETFGAYFPDEEEYLRPFVNAFMKEIRENRRQKREERRRRRESGSTAEA